LQDPVHQQPIFLSYAREDSVIAAGIAHALRQAGLEVWFDQDELRGGEAWDQKIRRQIRESALFLPIISQGTENRPEGYFRLEWKLAVERTHLMADGTPFIAPVVIDHTRETGALVPAEFLRVQWTRLVDGTATPQFIAQIQRLLHPPKPAAAASPPVAVARPIVPRRPSRARWWAAGLAAVALGAALWFFSRRASEPPAASAAPVAR